jgi:hypothetical protein
VSLLLSTGHESVLHAETVELGRRGDDGGTLKKYPGKSGKPKTCYTCGIIIQTDKHTDGWTDGQTDS